MSQKALAGADTPETPVRVPLGQLLIQAGFLTQVQLDDALYEGSRTGERLGEVVVRRGLATEDDVARLLAEQWTLDYVERSSIWFDANALARLSREDAQRLEALPTRVEDGRVVVAVAEPTEQRLGALRELLGEETVMIVVPKSALDAGLRSDLLRSRGQFGPSEELEHPRATPTSSRRRGRRRRVGRRGGGGGGGGDEAADDDGGDDGDEPMAEVTKLPVQKRRDAEPDRRPARTRSPCSPTRRRQLRSVSPRRRRPYGLSRPSSRSARSSSRRGFRSSRTRRPSSRCSCRRRPSSSTACAAS